jgi:hypothetical protein
MAIERITLNTTGTYPATFSSGTFKDTELRQVAPTTNYGTLVDPGLGFNSSENQRRNIIYEFPVSAAVQSASAIASVTLRVNIAAVASGSPFGPFDLHELLASFAEDQATWNDRATGTAWANPGATGGADIGSVLVSFDVTVNSGWLAITGSGLTSAFNAAKGSGVFRLLLKGGATEYNLSSGQGIKVAAVRTKEDTDGLRPVLEVDYTAAPVPPTATLNGTLDTITGAIVAGAAAITADLNGTLDSITGAVTVGGVTGRLTSALPLRDAARVVLANRSDVAVHVMAKPGLASVQLLAAQSITSGIWTGTGPFTPGQRYNVVYEVGGEPIGNEIITATVP